MEFFHGVNVDWMGKAKYFVALLSAPSGRWLDFDFRDGGLRYGIDFRGGTLVYVRFAGSAPIDQIRTGLAGSRLANSSIQQISDISNPNSKNDVVIGLEQNGQGDEALDAGKQDHSRRAPEDVRNRQERQAGFQFRQTPQRSPAT